eukprot:CAMPEP_0180326672 /NCGR_PEP_ID=MMETSP0988-20121125/39124_1 /TAXON_ID=697907 /ORGANISM="non described non described, Strain CCMP2293" /LENGTH=90 /DNA_ID=CAMNT_0022313267 /DNA_START=388 /DNA_END=660 /DNA_ORIENTATION=+
MSTDLFLFGDNSTSDSGPSRFSGALVVFPISPSVSLSPFGPLVGFPIPSVSLSPFLSMAMETREGEAGSAAITSKWCRSPGQIETERMRR